MGAPTSVNLDALTRANATGVPLDAVIETAWAITHHIYTNDNEVKFVRHLSDSRIASVVRSFLLEHDPSPNAIAKHGCQVVHGNGRPNTLNLDPSAPSYTLLVRRLALIILSQDGSPSNLESDQDSFTLRIVVHNQTVRGNFVAKDRTHDEFLSGIAETIQLVSETIAENWTLPLSQMKFLGPENWKRLARDAPETAVIGPSVMRDILDHWSANLPNKIAVEAWDGELTYSELHESATKLGQVLIQAGVGFEERVGICMKKSKWSIITFWGLLLVGITGVPLDVRNPKKRTSALLARVEARFVIADDWTAPGLEGIETGIIRCNADTLAGSNGFESVADRPPVTPQTVAFILFTSGSTGFPKAVTVEHGPLYGSTVEIARELYLEQSSKSFQFASFVSDISMGDIFSTMFKGGCIYVPSEEDRLSNLQFVLEKCQATHAALTSTVMSQLNPEKLTHLRYMIAVGEAISKENTVRWRPYVHMISAYGIAESIIYDSFASPENLASDYRSIGLAKGPCVWVTSIHDPEKLLPFGAVGEIVIEGPLLARGYMGDPQKTAERFIHAPSWLKAYRGERDDHRCYRSGDYGIKNPDGTTLYLGRADTQVKIRGQRVELGEIAFCLLNAEPSLGQVAVEAITLQSRGNTQTLAAFCKRPAGELDASGPSILPLDEETKALFIDVQSKLVEFLPQYMVPSLFIPVHDVPKNAAGKRDRITLLQWGAALTEHQISDYQLRTSSAEAAPETSAERLLHRVWAKVLRAPESSFGTQDNFFQAGGDSVKVIELLAALREQGKKITVAEVFQHPNMQEMAEHLIDMDETDKDCATKPFELFPGGRDAAANAIQQVAHACGVGTDAIEDIYPTTPLQEALMAISGQKAEAYTHRMIFSVPETLDIGRFQQACEKLVAEHSIFRTAILTLPDVGAVQVVRRSKIKWHEFETLDDMVHFDSITPFSYGSALCRYALVRAEQNVTHFVWSGHHSISDGWSRPAMFDELRHIYEHGTAHPQVPFTSFIKHVSRLDLDESDGFWREQFPDSVEQFPKLAAPGYTPRAEASGDISFSLGRREKSQITMATVLQAAWALVLGTYSNLDEAVFGLTLSGRDAPVPGITETMGVTITTVPVRIVFDNTSTIMEYLQEVQQYVSTIKNHQHVGLQRIQRLSPEARSATRFENLLVVQPVDEAEDHKALEDLGLRLVKREERDTDQYALTVKCTIGNADGSVHVKAHYDESILGRKLMQCLLHQFQHLAIHLAAESDEVSLHDLDRMSAHDLDLLAQWNGHVPDAVEQTLHRQFQERAVATPTAIALDGFDGRLTYEELDAQSAQLGHYLHSQVGVDLESRVILCFGKSKIPIISMLAVLKSGGVCVSINPEHPTPRLVEMIHDAEADVVLCDHGSMDRFKDHATHVVGVSESFIAKLNMTAIPGEPKLPHVAPSNASFVVFTSGSTGKPKGSLLEHRSLATDMDAVGERIGLDARSRTLQFSSYTFDAHILEIFGTLLRGGCVCVISDSERMNRLSEVMNERQVNFALLTKTVSRLLDPEKLPTLKSLILSGEANGRQDYWRWAERVKLFNGLGPSECTPLVCLTRDRVARDDDPANIGHPLACNIWITDHRRRDRLVPIGRVGELTVEGPIVGRGYINRPRENAASFFADPSWSRGGSGRTRRFYRSGDLARMNADGSITFLGRVDNQVKIHGQRVELGEIEDQLRRCSPAFVASAVDTVKMSSRGGATALVVFYAVGQEGQKTAQLIESASPILDLDEALEQQFRAAQANLLEALPSYMVPSLFIPVTHLPFNASGKLERNTLRNWVSALSAVQLGQCYLSDRTSLREPETKSEKHLQSLWAKVLEIPLNTIHAEDNFFRLGGDSVLSMRLIADARAEGLSMTVAEVFKAPVLQDLAESVSDRYYIQEAGISRKVPYEPFSLLKDNASVDDCIKQAAEDCNVSLDMIEDIYPSTPTQEALMAVSSHRPKAYTYQIILKIPTSMDIGLFQSTWEKMVSDQAIFRTRIIFRRGVGSLQVALRTKVSWKFIGGVPLSDYLDENGALLVEYGTPLCKFAILQHQSERVFVGTLHHSLYDGWSLMRTYQIFSSIFKGERPRPLVPYTRFFELFSTVDEAEMDDFWRREFPTSIKSYPQLPNLEYLPQPKGCKTCSMDFAQRANSGITSATVIHTAWAILMSSYSDSEDVVFGLMLSGRDAPVEGIENVIGPTIATVPFRAHIDRSRTIAQILEEMQSKIADVRKYQHAGLQRIRRLSPEASAAVEFQNLLVVHTMGDAEITSPLGELGLQPERNEMEEFLDLALTAECTIGPGTLKLLINYDENVVAAKQVDFMIHQLEWIVTVLIRDSLSLKLCDIELSSPNDFQALASWNSNIGTYMDSTLHELYETQAQATPDAIATSGYDGEYTFQQVDNAANYLAAKLVNLGIGPEKHVVLCFRKATLPIIAILAVLKSGGVCVSLNIDHPLSRRLDLCQDVAADAVLCDSDQASFFSDHVPNVVVVDSDLISTGLKQTSPDWAKPKVLSSNAAFIIYTSGSTGKPKGCVLEHHSISFSLKTYATAFDVTEDTRFLQFAAYSFDAHILEIFGTLIHGGCVCVISEEERMNNLTQAINDRRANRVLFTPTVAQLVNPDDVTSIDTIALGAEPLTKRSIEIWSSTSRPIRVIQHYAPAETSNLATFNFRLGDEKDPANIGGAWACGVWITQRNNPDRLAPVGCSGEILVEGSVLAREYWNRPDATESAFITGPAWSQTGSPQDPPRRFYRTGDMGCFQADGSVRFIGRADRQVKINGQRVELAEVEYEVAQLLPIGSEVVVEICDFRSTASMIAFIRLPSFNERAAQSLEVASEEDLVNFRNLIRSIETRLPEKLPQYMIPSAFIPIAFIPTSASTKVERKRLREYAQNPAIEAYLSSENHVTKEQPRSGIESTLHLIWSQVLNLKPDEIGINENFTSLGGDSITAMQVVSECRKHGVKLQVASILEKKTIKAIAPLCTTKVQSAPAHVRAAADGERFGLSAVQSFYFEHEDQNWRRFSQSFLCRVKQGVSARDFQRAIDIVTNHHAMLRARFSRTADGWVQYTVGANSKGAHRFRSHTLDEIVSNSRADAVSKVGIEACCQESLAAIDIVKGPVFSVDFFNVENGDSTVYMAAHHLVIDLVSWRIIWRDIEDILRHNATGLSPAMHFSSWVALQRKMVEGEQSISAAKTYLSSLPASHYSFWSVPGRDNILEHSVEMSFSLSPEDSSLILGKANDSMRTAPMDIVIGVFLKCFQQTFPERVVPTLLVESHGRESPGDPGDDDASRTVGWLTSLCPLHVPVVASSSPKDAIRLAKDTRLSVPKSGQSFFNFSCLTPGGRDFKHYADAEVLVNYSGIFQQLETNQSILQLESRLSIKNSEETDAKSRRFAMIDLEVGVSCGVMQFSFITHKNMAHQDRFRSCIELFQVLLAESLRQLEIAPPTFTLADFPRLRLSHDELEDLVQKSLPRRDFEHYVSLIEDIYPCTAMQEGILLSQQTSSQVYQLKHVWEFKDSSAIGGDVISKVEKAWKLLASRHSSLRTAIVEYASHDGHFVQVVLKELPPSRFVLSQRVMEGVHAVSGIAEAETHAFWEHLPQLTIYNTKAGKVACGLKLSHALIDGTSLDLLMEQLINLTLDHTESPDIHDFGKYVDYEQGIKSEDDVDYWAEYLKGAQPCHIPVGKSVDSEVEYCYIKLPEDTAEGLGRFSRDHGITQAVVIQAAWAVVLGAFTGQEEVCFGYLASGRDAPLDGIEQSIGLYISMQVCRVHLGGLTGTLLTGINDGVIAGLKHRNCSLAKIQSILGLNGLPLFNTCLTIRRFLGKAAASRVGDLVTVLEGAEKTEFAIALDASVRQEGAEVGMSYQKSIVSPALAASIAGSLETVIRSILRSDHAPIRSIDLIGKNDDRLVKHWNQRPEKVSQTLHGLVEQQVLDTPGKIATSGFDGEYTYSELNSAANKLAYHLGCLGVGIETRVVLCFAKSTWPVIAMLSILKAGGVCVSTNPDHPDARLFDIVQDVKATVVVCDEANAARFLGHVPHVITLNKHALSQLQVPPEWAQPVVRPENAAFIVYTSGSTGKPKGCILEHHSVSKSQIVNAEAMRIMPTSRVMQFAAYTFDASICEIFAPLIVGACLCIASDGERMDDLAGVINARKANWIMLTPTVAQLFSPAAVPTLDTLVFGGEPLSKKAVEIWQGHVHLINYWGPSECSNSGCLNKHISTGSDPMNIGPASGCNVWITIHHNPHKLAPIGCVGELLVEGPMLGRGYINRPEATAAAFVTGLGWAEGSGRKFYRTGDLGRFNPDGSITITGRADNQVKIHGQRVELGEIKHQIATRLPSGSEVIIDMCAVGVYTKKSVLSAFIKLEVFSVKGTDSPNLKVNDAKHQQEFRGTVEQLKQALASVLPQYMVPSAYIPVSRIPITPSAKTDKKLLREFALGLTIEAAFMQDTALAKQQPTNEVEQELQNIWVKVLNVPAEKIGIHDSFMSIGGDSITAMRVVALCRKAHLKLPVSAILQKKTIAAIAPHCERDMNGLSNTALDNAPQDTWFDLTPIQKRYFEQESKDGRIQYNQSLMLRLKRDVTTETLRAAFDLIVSRHGMLRARFEIQDGTWQQKISARNNNSYRFASHQFDDFNEHSIIEIARQSSSTVDIVDGPVFSVDLFNILSQDGVVFLAAHHLVMDIVSWQIILGELEEIIKGVTELSQPNLTFQRWAQILKSEITHPSEDELPLRIPPSNYGFWQVPVDENVFKHSSEVRFDLPTATTDMILNQSNKAMSTTPLEIMLGPLLLSFRKLFPERDNPSVFIEHHGREALADGAVEASQVVGWFTTMHPVHIPLEPDTTVVESIRRVKDLRRRVPRNGLPYFVSRHLTAGGAEKHSQHDPAELLINYSGAFQQLESRDSVLAMETRVKELISDADPRAHRWAMIDVEISISDGALQVTFFIHKKMAHLDRVQQWIDTYKNLLTQAANELPSIPFTFTPSDFPLLDVSHDALSTILHERLPSLGRQAPENVQDMLPTSPFQRFALRGHLDDPPRHWTHYYFELPHDVDVGKLRNTCVNLVKHYSILRTIFVQHEAEFVQIVLKSYEPKVDYSYEETEDITTLMETIFHRDLGLLPPLGRPFLRFAIIQTPTRCRLLMRLSHAQFDGFSRLSFVKTLANLYHDPNYSANSLDYAEFIQQAERNRAQGSDFWRNLLLGSHPTSVLNINENATTKGTVIRVEKTIPRFRKLEGITSATFFNAACAILIQTLTNASDVTFCRFASGRGGLDAKFQELVGPCANLLPLRVRFPQGYQTEASHVFEQIHEQSIQSIPHETFGLDDIIRECTDWSTSMATFPIITQHLNLEEGSESELDGAFSANVWEPETADPFPWSLALGAFPGRAGVNVSIAVNSNYMERAMVDKIHEGLCQVIGEISRGGLD